MPEIIILIPARMTASRLPGKPLADIAGQPMIVHVLRRALAAGIGEVAVATDSEAVAAAVEKAGGRAIMTRADHASGSDRIFEALEALDPQRRIGTVVNVQGDLPSIEPADIRAAIEPLADPAVDIATLAAVITDPAERSNPNVVKVMGRSIGPDRLHAVTFTRADATGPGPHYHHIGLYAYRRAALERFVRLPPSANEQRERLEQLRALDAGMRIDVAVVKSVPLGVDTPDELGAGAKLTARLSDVRRRDGRRGPAPGVAGVGQDGPYLIVIQLPPERRHARRGRRGIGSGAARAAQHQPDRRARVTRAQHRRVRE
jgi:3-deoxy-manno-octulosonate cytidylyltransferase (CMP-KDO synthetase)